SWTGESALRALSLARTGQDPIAIRDAVLGFSGTPFAGVEGSAGADFSGTVTLDGGVFACVANLPTAVSPDVTLRLTGGDAKQSADAVLRACGVADVLGTDLPRSLLDLAGAEITGFEV